MPRADGQTRPTARRRDGYAVELPGRLSPSLLCSLSREGTRRSEVRSLVESVFVLPQAEGDLPEVAARLHAHGLVVLGIRKLAPGTPGAPTSGEDRP
jgi:hypothetical protein